MLPNRFHPETALSKIFIDALRIYQNHFRLFLSIALIYALQAVIVNTLNRLLPPAQALPLIIANALLFGTFAAVILVHAARQAYLGHEMDFSEAGPVIRKYYWRFLAVSLARGLLILLGSLFFIIPGLLAGTFLLFTDILVILEDLPFIVAFERSYAIVREHFWKALAFVVIIGLLSIAPTSLISLATEENSPELSRNLQTLIMLFLTPFLFIVQVGFYRHLTGEASGEHVVDTAFEDVTDAEGQSADTGEDM